jgi:hypothetical protein
VGRRYEHLDLTRRNSRSREANLIIGDFVDFLLRRFPARIQAINIIPRK